MSFWNQLREALRLQIEDFFRVPWQAVAVMLVVIALLIEVAYLRTVYPTGAFFGPRMALLLVVIALLRAGRRFLKP